MWFLKVCSVRKTWCLNYGLHLTELYCSPNCISFLTKRNPISPESDLFFFRASEHVIFVDLSSQLMMFSSQQSVLFLFSLLFQMTKCWVRSFPVGLWSSILDYLQTHSSKSAKPKLTQLIQCSKPLNWKLTFWVGAEAHKVGDLHYLFIFFVK